MCLNIFKKKTVVVVAIERGLLCGGCRPRDPLVLELGHAVASSFREGDSLRPGSPVSCGISALSRAGSGD